MDKIESEQSLGQNNNQESQDIVDEEIEERKIVLEEAKKHFDEFVIQLKEKANDIVDLEQFKDQFKFKIKLKNISFEEINNTWERVKNKITSCKSPKKNWSEDEVNIMIWIVIKYAEQHSKDIEDIEDENFEIIAKMIPFKDGITFKHKWLQMKQINLAQIPWTKEEDDILTQIYLDFKKQDKQNKWSDISKVLENRTKLFRRGKQCRERWNNYLDPEMNRGFWSDEEDFKLLSIALEIGSTQWSSLAKRLSKRTENAVKNRFKSLMKKERKERIKNGQDVKSAESLTEHIDKDILIQILEKLKKKITMKNIQFSSENNQINSINPPYFQIYFNPQQNFSQLHHSTTATSFMPQPQQQQMNFSLINAQHQQTKSPSTSPDHSPRRMMSLLEQKIQTQPMVQPQQMVIKPKEEDFSNQLNLTNGFNSFSQAQFQYQQSQHQIQQQNQGQILADQTLQQQNQALQQQFQNLNLNVMSPMNQQLLKNQLIQQQILQQQQQQLQVAQQQQQVNQGIPSLSSLQGVQPTPNIATLMQNLQSQAMQSHTNLVSSPKFIQSNVPNNGVNGMGSQMFNQVSSSNDFSELILYRSMNNVPNSFSDAMTGFNGPSQTQNGAQLNPALAQVQNNGLIGAKTTPFIQLANPAAIFQNQMQGQLPGVSPSSCFQMINPQPNGEFTPKIPGLGGVTSNHSFSCGNTPSSSRNKRSDKPNLFSDYDKLQKIRISEHEEIEQMELKQEKSGQKKAHKMLANQKIEEVEEDEQNLLPENKTEVKQNISQKQDTEKESNEKYNDSPIQSQNNLKINHYEQDSDSNNDIIRHKNHLQHLQYLQSQNSSFNKFRKEELYSNSIIKPQKLPITPSSAHLFEEETKNSPQKLIINGQQQQQQQKLQNQSININLNPNPQLQNGLNPINLGSLNNFGSMNDVSNPQPIPISQNQFSNHQLSFQQLDYLSQQQKQLQQMCSPSHKQNSGTPRNLSIYSQMNPVSPSNSQLLLQQKQYQQQLQQQQQPGLLQNTQPALSFSSKSNEYMNQQQIGLFNNNSNNNQKIQIEMKEADKQNDFLVIQNMLPSLTLQQIELLQQQIQQQQIAKKNQEQQQQLLQQQMQQNSSIQKLMSQQHMGNVDAIHINLTQTNINQY